MDRTTRREGNTEVAYENWRYELKIENTNAMDLDGVEIQYKIFKTVKADASRYNRDCEGMSLENGAQVRTGTAQVGMLPRLREVPFNTETIQIAESKLDGGWYYASGSKSTLRDELDGIWLKLFRNGKEIYEFKSNDPVVKAATWSPAKPASR